jgi:putative adhesin
MILREYGVIVLATIVSIAQGGAQEPGVLEEDVEQSYPIDPNATVSIRNLDGSIRIYGGTAAELNLYATKKAYSEERLKQISIDVSAQPNTVSIETKFPPRPKWGVGDRSGTVDYVLVLPQTCSISRLELSNGEVLIDGMRGANLNATLSNGRMFGRNCYGDVGLAVTNGDLDVAYDWWERRPFSLHAATTNGDVRAFVPGEAAFHLLAASVNGQVASDFTGQQDRQAKSPRKIDMLVGEKAEAQVSIHATNGNVNIVEVNP